MSGLHLPPKFVAREKEFELLKQRIERARQGSGSTVFIAGESGVGKTRLVEELISFAERNGFQVLRSQCFLESLAPYAPMAELLKEAGLEHLLTETKPPKIEGIYAVKKGGIIIAKHERKETVDSDIFMGMVTAVETFVKDSIAQMQRSEVAEQIGHMGYGNFHIVNVPGHVLSLVAVTTGRENEYLISDMRELIIAIEKDYGEMVEKNEKVKPDVIEEKFKTIFSSGKYEGIDYAEDDAKIRQVNLFENVSRGLQRKAEEKPVLIFIDDLQWCDPSSLAMLHYIARNTRKNRVLILGAYRNEELGTRDDGKVHQLVEAMEKMEKEELIEKVELKRLDKAGCHALICSVLGSEIGSEFTEKIYRETEGNTFFVIEIMKNLDEENLLKFEDGKWHYTLEALQIPKRIYELVLRRLQRLAKEERELLDAASVLGDEFTSQLLAKLTELDRLQVVRILVNIERTHKLIRALKEKYRFEHAKIREVLYAELPEELKTLFHEITGKILEEDYKSGIVDVLEDIVYHYSKAKVREKVIEYGLNAGKLAKKRFANEETIRFYTGVLEALGEDTGATELKLQILWELSEVLELAGRYEEALEILKRRVANTISTEPLEAGRSYRKRCEIYTMKGEYEKAMEEAEKAEQILSGETKFQLELAMLWSAMGYVHERKGEYRQAIEYQEKARQVFEKVNAEKEKAAALHRIGSCYWYLGDYQKSLEFLSEALAIRERIKDLPGLAATYNNIGVICDDRGEYDRALEYHTKSLELKEKIGNVWGIAFSYNNIGIIYHNKGEYEKALEYYTKSLELKEKIGDVWGIAFSYNNIGIIYHNKGEYEKALEYHTKGLELKKKIGDVWGIASSYNNIGDIYNEKGEYEKALEFYTKSQALYEQIEDGCGIAFSYLSIGTIWYEKGQYEKAIELFEKSIQHLREMENKIERCFSLLWISEGYLAVRNLDAAKQSLAEARAIGKEVATRKIDARTSYVSGRILIAEGRTVEAAEELRKAVELYESMGMLSFDYYKALFELGRAMKDRERIEEALAFFERIGNKVWTERIRAEIAKL